MIELSETLRKGIHISSLVIPFSYRYLLGFNRKLAFYILLAAFIINLTIEFHRFWQKSFKKTFYRIFGLILRRHEMRDFTGATYLIFSAMICVAFFEPLIAFCAMAFVSIGDTFAAIIGINFGKRKFLGMRKSLEGSLACFVSTFIFGLFFLNSPVQALFGSIAATVAELVNIPVDDNLKIPVFSAIVMTLTGILI
ncbi:MAG: phosphatidate cytidylyltransferase [Candidatus Cloacimonadaceae bacterium]|nr:phosphatidate cytidylyltransferase [Candidatus Cloacimonadaceae bacterium]MDP3114663.1 phosphatidate cytidylyltransferase [Candidatus Cloacimonadaceae bacterium]